MQVAGLIVAGGAATRMGSDKPFCRFHGGTLLDAVIDRVRPQVETLMLNVRPEHAALCKSRYGEALPLVFDAYDGKAGPLGGIIAGLQRSQALGAPWLATFPCDTPFLPKDLVAALSSAAPPDAGRPVVAFGSGKVQSLCALWPSPCLRVLQEGVALGTFRSAWWTLEQLRAIRVELSAEPHAFLNINTAKELADAETLPHSGESP